MIPAYERGIFLSEKLFALFSIRGVAQHTDLKAKVAPIGLVAYIMHCTSLLNAPMQFSTAFGRVHDYASKHGGQVVI
jgi:hypothetical protein